MANDRRKFLKLSALLASGISLHLYSCGTSSNKNVEKVSASLLGEESDFNFGIQLYSLKEDMAEDAKAVLQQLSKFGYRQIESFEGKSGMFWGMSNKEFKQFTGDLGLDIISSHCNTNENFEQKAELAAEIGMKYLISPWVGPQKSVDDYKRLAEHFNKCGEICKSSGLRFAYHNHDYTFKEIDGIMPQDLFVEETDKDLVDFELDIFWVANAGVDPAAHIEKYGNRIRLCHVKDRSIEAVDGKFISTILGTGSINFPDILARAKKSGMEYFFVEQEQFINTTPIEAASKNAQYMKEKIAPAILSV